MGRKGRPGYYSSFFGRTAFGNHMVPGGRIGARTVPRVPVVSFRVYKLPDLWFWFVGLLGLLGPLGLENMGLDPPPVSTLSSGTCTSLILEYLPTPTYRQMPPSICMKVLERSCLSVTVMNFVLYFVNNNTCNKSFNWRCFMDIYWNRGVRRDNKFTWLLHVPRYHRHRFSFPVWACTYFIHTLLYVVWSTYSPIEDVSTKGSICKTWTSWTCNTKLGFEKKN